jgi:tetratricopeptide (TPR) repeat protein
MMRKVWIHKLSFKLSRGIGWRLAVSLAFCLFLGAGMQESRAAADWRLISAPAQDQKRLAAQRKFEEGESLSKQGKPESMRLAVKKYEEALLLWRDIGDRREEADTLGLIGNAYNELGENQKALDFLARALPLWREVGDRLGEAATLGLIGDAYNALGEKQKALDFYSRALPLFRAAGERESEATTLRKIGAIYESLGEKQKALDFYAQADAALSRNK